MNDIEPVESDLVSPQEASVESMLPQEQISPAEVRQIRLDHLERQLNHVFEIAGGTIPVAKERITQLVEQAKNGDEKAMVELNKGPLRTAMLLIAQETKLMKEWEKTKLDPVLTPAEKTHITNLKQGLAPDAIVDILERMEEGELGSKYTMALYREIMIAQGKEGDTQPVGQFGAVKIAQKLEHVANSAKLKPPDEDPRSFPSVRRMMPKEEADNGDR